jgi:hypothetical protein
MGYESVKAIGEKRKGSSVAARMDLPARLIERKDLDLPDVKALLFPDLQKWLKNDSQH